MAKSTKSPSKTSRNTGSSTTKKTAAPKRAATTRTASGTTNKTEKKQPAPRATSPQNRKKMAAQKAAPSRSTSKNTKSNIPAKPANISAPPSQRTAENTQQKRVGSSLPPSRPANDTSTMRGRPAAPQRPEQRSQQNAPQQRQPQNRPVPNQPLPPTRQEQKNEQPSLPEKELNIKLDQSVAILIDGNNIEMSLHSVSKSTASMINFDKLIPTLLGNRALSRLIYFREGKSISPKLAERLQKMFHGSVVPCHKSADIPLSIKAVQVASKVDTIIILSGDADYVELVRHLKHDGIRVEIAAFPETTADILRQESDYFFPITVDYSFALK